MKETIYHESDIPTPSRLIFDILNLSSALFLHGEDTRVNAIDEKHLDGKARLIYQTVSKILEEVAAAGHRILLDLRTSTPTLGLVSARSRVSKYDVTSCLDFCEIGIPASVLQFLSLEGIKFFVLRPLVLVRCLKVVSSVFRKFRFIFYHCR